MNQEITSADFGVPSEFAECVEKYVRWCVSNALAMQQHRMAYLDSQILIAQDDIRDAMRYRWIRNVNTEHAVLVSLLRKERFCLDNAIDAAMKGTA